MREGEVGAVGEGEAVGDTRQRPWRPRTRRGEGAISQRLAKMLSSALGFEVTTDNIWVQSIYWIKWGGCALWGANIIGHGDICSWDSMTVCVRYGFTVEDCRGDRTAFADFEIYALPLVVAGDGDEAAALMEQP